MKQITHHSKPRNDPHTSAPVQHIKTMRLPRVTDGVEHPVKITLSDCQYCICCDWCIARPGDTRCCEIKDIRC